MSETIMPETEVDLKKSAVPAAEDAEQKPPEPISVKIEEVEIATPKTASEAFMLLSVRTAEVATALKEKQLEGAGIIEQVIEGWALMSEILGELAAFAVPCSYASARHVLWAYEAILKRIPEAAKETRHFVGWLRKSRIPACATDKAAPAAMLFYHLTQFASAHYSQMPRPQKSKHGWLVMKGGLEVAISNEESFQLQKKRAFWERYSGRLFGVVGVLLREICGVKEQLAEPPAAEAQQAQAEPADAAAAPTTDDPPAPPASPDPAP